MTLSSERRTYGATQCGTGCYQVRKRRTTKGFINRKLKFKSYTKTDMSKVTEKIKQELCKYGISEKAPLPLMEKIISKFYIGGEKGLQIKLINEKILGREG